MRTQLDPRDITGAVEMAIEELNTLFKGNPLLFFTEAELHSYLYGLLTANPMFSCQASWGACSLVHQEYPTPFRCDMGNGRFAPASDESRFRRGHYDLVVLNPWWVDKTSCEALMGKDFRSFCAEVRDKAAPDDPPLCLVGIEMYLVRSERFTKTGYSLIGQDYRKLLFSGVLSSGWRFMDHRYMLVYGHRAAPDQGEWGRLQGEAARGETDLQNTSISWICP
jgi:hypothetical protein